MKITRHELREYYHAVFVIKQFSKLFLVHCLLRFARVAEVGHIYLPRFFTASYDARHSAKLFQRDK